jgi:ribosome-associated toxin RatA of RatAB toxin-antitoxin module
MLTTIQRSALVTHSTREMYELVNDVENYPSYMEGCVDAQILEQGEDFMVARLDLKKSGVSYSFATRNELKPFEEIRLTLHSGPFKRLAGSWVFKPLTDTACKVSLHLEFESNSQLMGIAATSLFSSVANNLVTALSERADKVYGK